ncbi:unnamed protein product [Clavelina lepadiformis]|uniref:EF-hand domain-containing protein n=1 Tax=Clavelina lepadiformis TaxID=159417 RepID=A0ABP0GXP2_CLALP
MGNNCVLLFPVLRKYILKEKQESENTQIQLNSIEVALHDNLAYEVNSTEPALTESKCDDKQETGFDEIFHIFDRNDNGAVGIKELKTIFHLTQHYATDSELKAIVKDINKNRNDLIRFDDFQEFAKNELKCCTDDIIRNAFRVFDSDDDGYIGRDDLRNLITVLLSPPTEEDLNDFLEEADRKGNGTIDFDDFLMALDIGV